VGLRKDLLAKPGGKINLSKWDPDDTGKYKVKADALDDIAKNTRRLTELQYLLYAESKYSLLIVLQALDTGGKDGCIRHVMGPINPQGCRVRSFKKPTDEELSHDFLWRIHKQTPPKGIIGIFNRSHYEDVLVVRVHNLVPKSVWSKRYKQINDFEKMLADNGTHIVKFFLHISKGEQKKRLNARLDNPDKHWKVDPGDYKERNYWNDYTKAFETVLSRCSKPWAPWYIIPADKKWYRNYVVSKILVDTLEDLEMSFPDPKIDIPSLRID
jgi:PPK2 family polyphosphate:nucleotide phosphotransferase